MDGALIHSEPPRKVVLDKLMMNHLETKLIGDSLGDVFTERAHLPRHYNCDHNSLLAPDRAEIRPYFDVGLLKMPD